ncbi:MAG: GMC family oxidoreductase [Bradymonadales bacterium]|nr:GMC family oxidoreductase [Bradymonadales bacterium]
MLESIWAKLSSSEGFWGAELSTRERRILLAIARAAIPGDSRIPDPDEKTIDRYGRQFALYRPAHRGSLRAVLWGIEHGSLLSGKRRFSRLNPLDQQAQLQSWHDRSPVNRLGLRALLSGLKMAHFDNPTIFASLGCRYQFPAPPVSKPPAWKDNLFHLPDLENDQTLTVDVVVVGTGAGGAVVAKELADLGLSVAMVEEGVYREPSHHQGRPPEALNTLYRGGPAVFTVGNTPIWTPSGKVVGGTTTIGLGTCGRPPDRVLHEWRHKFGLREFSPDNMAVYLERVEQILQVAPTPDHLLDGCARVVRRGCEALGYTRHGPVLRSAPGCRGSGTCAFGCPTGAKLSCDLSYVPLALEKKALLFTGARVHTVVVENGAACGIEASVPIRLRRPGMDTKLKINANRVVLACGPYATPALLLRNNLANSSSQVGRNLSLHPGMTLLAEFDEPIEAHHGVPQGYQVTEFDDEGIFLQAIFTPLDVTSSLYPAIGPEFTRLMESYNHLAGFGFTIQDSSRGKVFFGPGGHPVVYYRLNRRDLQRIRRGIQILSEIFFAAGARQVYPGVYRYERIRGIQHLEQFRRARITPLDLSLSAYHPLGTARMGVNPKKSVVGPDHETHDIRQLYVVDGSCIPTSLGVPPQLTIMAMATRAAERIARRL